MNISELFDKKVELLRKVETHGNENFQSKIEELLKKDTNIKAEDIAYIGAFGKKVHPCLKYATEDIGESKEGNHYLEIKITGNNGNNYPVTSLFYEVKGDLHKVTSTRHSM